MNIRFADGCAVKDAAQQFVTVQPGHYGWAVGDEITALIAFDFEGGTVNRLEMPKVRRHGGSNARGDSPDFRKTRLFKEAL
jgi:hypothetical protein